MITRLFNYSGILAVLTLWVSVATSIIVADLPLLGIRPLSSLGVIPSSSVYFSVGLITSAILILIFTLKLNALYKPSGWFFIVVLIGQVGQIMSAIVPFGGNQPARAIHTIAAFVLAFSVPVVLGIFYRSLPDGSFRLIAYRLFVLELAAFILGIGFFVLVGKAAPVAQGIPAVVFHAWLVTTNLAYLQKPR